MSIATDEAEKLPILENLYKKADLYNNVITFKGANDVAKAAYIAVRTAKPTEAETWVIARALYEHHADLEYSPEVPDGEWERYKSYYIKTPMKCYEFTIARKALSAARKAVTGNE